MSKFPLMSHISDLRLTSRPNAKVASMRVEKLAFPFKSDIDTFIKLWDGADVLPFKLPGRSLIHESDLRFLQDGVADEFRNKNMAIMKGMSAEKKFMLFAIDYSESTGIRLPYEQHMFALAEHNERILVLTDHSRSVSDRVDSLLADSLDGSLSMARMLMLMSGQEMLTIINGCLFSMRLSRM